ncbi:MAG: c-type cytochrome [Gemmatimonadaceae bacterium]|nr:c-type cytochrome [Gemmatimonadaceae bacterium]
MISIRILFVSGMALIPAVGLAQDAGERPVSTGVFSEAQAARGLGAYRTSCESCHAKSEYTGDKFKVAWVSRTAFDLFDVIRSQMPEDNPGSLERQEYVDIVAYIFSLNAYPAGSAELPADDDGLKKVRIDNPPGGAPAAARSGRRLTPHPRIGFRQ